MYNYYELSIIPIILKKFKVNNIIISGMPDNLVSNLIFNYCDEHDVSYTVIDTHDLEIDYIKDYSLNALSNLNNYGAIFLNDDPNWYTVYNELKIINKNNEEFPLVFICHNIFPHKRRDSYIDPNIIPKEFINENSKTFNYNGIELRDGFYHAVSENTPKNGVLTAIEDFLVENTSLGMMNFKLVNGIVILYPKNSISQIRLGVLSEEIGDYVVDYDDLEDNFVENQLLTKHISKFKILNEKMDILEGFKDELDEKNRIISDYENKSKLHNEELFYKDSQLESYNSKLNLKELQIKNIESKLVNNENELNDLNNKLQFSDNEVNNLKNEINQSKQNFKNKEIEYNNKIADVKSQIESLELNISRKEQNEKNLKNQLQDANSQINDNIKELSLKNNELYEKELMLNSIKNQCTHHLSKLDSKEYCITCYKEKISNSNLEIEYLKKGTFTKKLLSPIGYLYLIFKSKPREISLNFKLYKALKNSKCFDMGFYLNNNTDLIESKWYKYFSLELHYICNGFDEKRKFNKKYFNRNSKKELLEYILNCKH